ncbi:MAG TPA: hypothetical protein PLF22_01565 [Pseudomonadales bacterium]|nr:hypothetical protein [Pseudomonadales bacterium]
MEKRLLVFLSAAHIAAGLLLCLLYFFVPLHPFLLQVIYAARPEVISNETQIIFWLCILGPTIASWGVLFLALVRQYFLTPTVFLWRCMVMAIFLWAPLDSMLCLSNGIYVGAIGNSVVTVVFLALLFRIRNIAI